MCGINLIEYFEDDTVTEDMKYRGDSVNSSHMDVEQL
jgi:hypothetical protein